MKKFSSPPQSGQSLLEVVAAITVAGMLVMGLVVGLTWALKVSRDARSRSRANKFSQEALELVRRERDTIWSTFYARRNQTYCMDATGSQTLRSGTCPRNLESNVYSRTISYSWLTSPDRMQVSVSVDWGTQSSSRLVTELTKWR